MLRISIRHIGIAATAMVALSACTSLPTDVKRTVSVALPSDPGTRLAVHVQPMLEQEPQGHSGFEVLSEGMHSYRSRIAVSDLAENSLDIQTYMWRVDVSGMQLASHVWAAAERGVRVRILLDDIDVTKSEFDVAAFDLHRNIEVRLFNPWGQRGFAPFRQAGEWLVFRRLNRRMHNKLFVADSVVGVAGGRNLTDRYFGIDKSFNFRDMELLAAGPVVADLLSGFDSYWNSEWAYPISELQKNRLRKPRSNARTKMLEDWRENVEQNEEYLTGLGEYGDYVAEFLDNLSTMAWGKSRVVFDDPSKVDPNVETEVLSNVSAAILEVTNNMTTSLVFESAYFVPSDSDLAEFYRAAERGVDVTVITNSLQSNNSAIAHTGYSPYRKELLQHGIHICELRPDARSRERFMVDPARKRKLSLHAKFAVVDESVSFVGSFNMDPRSANLNTEMGIFVESEELAGRLLDEIEYDLKPENAWCIRLDENQKIRWDVLEGGVTRTYSRNPKAGIGRRMAAGFFHLLPIKSQL